MLNILIVDDSMLIRKTLSKVIKELGYNVIGEAKNGLEAIEMYNELYPDIVTMDITMPEMDGVDALLAIKQKDKKAKVIMITSHGEENLVMKAIIGGAKGYILKPIDKEKVEASIKKIFPFL